MYNAIIDGSVTYLYLDEENKEVYDCEMSGFLINNENIINLMESIPVKQYYARTRQSDNPRIKITKEQAYYLYQCVIDYNNNKTDELNNKLK